MTTLIITDEEPVRTGGYAAWPHEGLIVEESHVERVTITYNLSDYEVAEQEYIESYVRERGHVPDFVKFEEVEETNEFGGLRFFQAVWYEVRL